MKSTNLKELFAVDFDNYKQAIRDAATKMAQSTMSLLHLDDVMIKFGLSGGLDSRIILAAVLQNQNYWKILQLQQIPIHRERGISKLLRDYLRILISSSMMTKK